MNEKSKQVLAFKICFKEFSHALHISSQVRRVSRAIQSTHCNLMNIKWQL